MERVIPLFIKKIRNHEPITIYGSDKVLDFTYVDVVQIALVPLERDDIISLVSANGRSLTTLQDSILHFWCGCSDTTER